MKKYAWPECTVPNCGHKQTHATEVRAKKAASNSNQRQFTTSNGHAVCVCHTNWWVPDTDNPGMVETPKQAFKCDESRQEREPVLATVDNFGGASQPAPYDRNAARADIAAATEQPPAPEPEPVPLFSASPIDPRDERYR